MDFQQRTSEWQSLLTLAEPTASAALCHTSSSSVPRSADFPKSNHKIRASCDACAAAKIKCSKEQPICLRCTYKGLQCVYGVSRKYGKPGRICKKSTGETSSAKRSKQRSCPDKSEFGRFRIETNSQLNVSPEPSWTCFPELDLEVMPSDTDLSFLDDMFSLPTPQMCMESVQEPKVTFTDPFTQKPPVKLDLSQIDDTFRDLMVYDHAISSDFNFTDTTPVDASLVAQCDSSSPTSPTSPTCMRTQVDTPQRLDTPIQTSHCNCHTLAYSTLESLHIADPDPPSLPKPTCLDSILSTTKTAVATMLQLLGCSCSSSPHLATMYSRIISKILAWYQIAAGVPPTLFTTAPLSTSSSSSSPSSSTFSSPLSARSLEDKTFNIEVKPVKIGLYRFDEAEQELLRRQVVLRELRKCGALVEALASRERETSAGQAKFTYGVLCAWLESELHKTLREVEEEQEQEL